MAEPINPYAAAPIEAFEAEVTSTEPIRYKLFTPSSVALATFFGTPIAGGLVMAINYRRLRRSTAAVQVVLGGFVATVIVLIVAMAAPDVPGSNLLFTIGQLWIMYAVAAKLQGQAINSHYRAGGRSASGWAAAGIGVLVLIVLVAVFLGVVLALDTAGVLE